MKGILEQTPDQVHVHCKLDLAWLFPLTFFIFLKQEMVLKAYKAVKKYESGYPKASNILFMCTTCHTAWQSVLPMLSLPDMFVFIICPLIKFYQGEVTFCKVVILDLL